MYTKQDWHILLEKPVLDVQTNNTSGQIKWVVTTVGSEAIKKLKIKYGKVRVSLNFHMLLYCIDFIQ